jgi:hypothetical protein
MTSKACQLFLDSMLMNFERWHDGIGYDLEALAQLDPLERSSMEKLLIQHLTDRGDWRDVQALAALNTPAAREAVDKARFHKKPKVRHYALRIMISTLDAQKIPSVLKAELEEQVIQAVMQGAYEMAESMPTRRVKQALLDSVLVVDRQIRVSAAAFLLYICGQTSEPFDWDQRPFFLRFGKESGEELRLAWEELRRRAGL